MDISSLVDYMLKMQVDTAWQTQVAILDDLGLSHANHVLDIGTGNGYFLCKLAKHYPNKQFTGIEMAVDLANTANKYAHANNLSNVDIIHAQCPSCALPMTYDMAIARLCLYNASNRCDIISWVRDQLNPGGQFAIMDVNDDNAYSYPHHDAFSKLIHAINLIANDNNWDRCIGKKLPSLLIQAGYKDIRLHIQTGYSSFEMDIDSFYNLLYGYASITRKVIPDAFTEADYKNFMAFLDELKNNPAQICVFPSYLVSGRK